MLKDLVCNLFAKALCLISCHTLNAVIAINKYIGLGKIILGLRHHNIVINTTKLSYL